MSDFAAWRHRHPQAAAELDALFVSAPWPTNVDGVSEGRAQQEVRMSAARQGAKAWRNNVGATKAREQHSCPRCSHRFEVKKPPIRYGLANDSMQLNSVMKSSDVILAIPRIITQPMVGTQIAQFGAVEVKRPGWNFNPNDPHEQGQANWLMLIASLGGFARWSTGVIEL